jgi:hypothetical protein
MGCGCKIPVVQYPETAEWGPLAWDILHGLAERSGSGINPADERRGWVTLFGSIALMLPCEICREHFKVYLAEHPVDNILDMDYKLLKNYVKTWLWTLHNIINNGNSKESFPFDGLTSKYKDIPILTRLKQLAAPMQRVMVHNGVRLLHWKAFENACRKQYSYS